MKKTKRQNPSGLVQKSYSRIAKTYHKQRRAGYKNKSLLANFAKRLKKGAKVIDLGSGSGVPVARFLASKGFEVTGIDFAAGMVKLARKNVPNAHFLQMDMTELSLPANSFDAAVSFYAIIHIPRERHRFIYKKLHKILRPNGLIFVNASGSDATGWEEYSPNYMGAPMFWSFYSPKKTAKLIAGAGFEIIWSGVLKTDNEEQFWVLARNKK